MKKIFLYTLIASLLFVSQACNDKLSLIPNTQLPTDESLSNIQFIQAAVTGMYSGLTSTYWYGRGYVVIGDLAADNAYISTNNSNRYLSSYRVQWLTSDGDVTNFWNQAYAVILRANNIINSIPDIKDGTDNQKNQAMGEALFIRALAHFDLVRFFSEPYAIGGGSGLGVPVIKEFAIGSPKRNTVDEVYEQVIADLTQARSLLTKNTSNPYAANYYAATALLAKVYLYKEDNANAITAATEVIDAPYTVADTADLTDMFNKPGGSEDIFTTHMTQTNNNGTDNLGSFYLYDGYGDARVSHDLVDVFDAEDARLNKYITTFPSDGSGAEEYENVKFLIQDGVSGLYSTKVLRISEMYLYRAEANAKLGKYADAIADVNVIRTHRNLQPLTGVANADVLDAVLLENRKEFMFEGHRYFDLLRNKKDIVRNTCNQSYQINTRLCTIPATSLTAIAPIPQRETDVNPNMEQNPGYKK